MLWKIFGACVVLAIGISAAHDAVMAIRLNLNTKLKDQYVKIEKEFWCECNYQVENSGLWRGSDDLKSLVQQRDELLAKHGIEFWTKPDWICSVDSASMH
ncbi:hypothetical protein ACFL2B_02080 [Patescibacteria group bacterium]